MTRVIWALDPFERGLTVDRKALDEFRDWFEETGRTVEPVYVSMRPTGALTSQGDERRRIREAALEMATKIDLPQLPPTILEVDSISISRSVITLLDHAKATGAELIALSSHGRTGIPRLVLGSFAETLLAASRLPILFMNQRPRPEGSSLRKVVWATDFSEPCDRGFELFLNQAKDVCREIVIFHELTLPMEQMSFFSYASGLSPVPQELIDDQMEWAHQRGQAWVNEAESRGFDARLDIHQGVIGVGSAALAVANDEKAGWIAMAAQTQPGASFFFGSVARDVFSSGRYPTWIFGSQR